MAPFYHLRFDSSDRGQWFLGAPQDPAGRQVDPRLFTHGKPYEEMDEIKRGYLEAAGLRDLPAPETLTVPIDNPGHPLHFSFASHDMLVVAQHIGELIERMSPGDVERIPVRVEGRNEPYEILNVLTRIACIDRDRTVGELWPDASERAGEYRMIVRLALDPDRVPESIRIFQVGGWKVSVVVTEDLKEALEDATGLTFKPTAPPR